MAEEIEVPTEHLQERMHEEAERGGEPWLLKVALTAALLSACAAIAATLAAHYVNEATLEQIRASDTWTQYQAKSIKALVIRAKIEVLDALGKTHGTDTEGKLGQYGEELQAIEAHARGSERAAVHALEQHEIYARGVTVFQIAISICAIAALTRSRWLWYVSLSAGGAGVLMMGLELI